MTDFLKGGLLLSPFATWGLLHQITGWQSLLRSDWQVIGPPSFVNHMVLSSSFLGRSSLISHVVPNFSFLSSFSLIGHVVPNSSFLNSSSLIDHSVLSTSSSVDSSSLLGNLFLGGSHCLPSTAHPSLVTSSSACPLSAVAQPLKGASFLAAAQSSAGTCLPPPAAKGGFPSQSGSGKIFFLARARGTGF